MPIELNGADESVVGPIRESLKAAAKARALRFPDSEATPPSSELPDIATREGKLLGFAAGGAPIGVAIETIIAAVTGEAPGDLDTLEKLAAAIGDDPDFATNVADAIAAKMSPGDQWSPVVTEGGSSRVLALGDAGAYIRLTNAGAVEITVPPQSSVAWPANAEISFRLAAAGTVSITEGSGVTVHNKAGAADLAEHGNFALKRVAEDTWDFV